MIAPLGALDDDLRAVLLRRVDELIAYQDQRYASRYLDYIAAVHVAENRLGSTRLTMAAAQYLFKLMAYKDEYEVARLTGDERFAAGVADQFGDDASVAIRLHPPALRSMGMRNKISLGEWVRPGMSGLARMKRLRGTRLDPFGRAEVRRTERDLVVEYRAVLAALVTALRSGALGAEKLDAAVAVAELPDMVRGYEGIKMANVARYREELATRRAELGL